MMKPGNSNNIETHLVQMLQFPWSHWHKVNPSWLHCNLIHAIGQVCFGIFYVYMY